MIMFPSLLLLYKKLVIVECCSMKIYVYHQHNCNYQISIARKTTLGKFKIVELNNQSARLTMCKSKL